MEKNMHAGEASVTQRGNSTYKGRPGWVETDELWTSEQGARNMREHTGLSASL